VRLVEKSKNFYPKIKKKPLKIFFIFFVQRSKKTSKKYKRVSRDQPIELRGFQWVGGAIFYSDLHKKISMRL
jgi:hypothetical protein